MQPRITCANFGPTILNLAFIALLSLHPALFGQEQSQPANSVDDQIAKLKFDVCVQLERLLEFKDATNFKTVGFGLGGPYNQWLKDIERLWDAQPTGANHPIPLLLRAAPGDLLTLGLAYMNTNTETDYTRFIVPELKDTIGYADYLKNKAAAAQGVLREMRQWKDDTGKHTTRAKFVELVDGKVVLEKEDGTIRKVPLQRLSEDDRTFLEGTIVKNPKPK